MQTSALTDIGRVIQLAIAPVFLITGIGSLLSVLSGRLGRTIDRSRVLHALPDSEAVTEELLVLSKRAKLIYRAISIATTSALLICFVIVTLFLSAFVHFPIGAVIAVLFVAAIVALIVALVLFLREVFFATRALRIDPR